MDFLITQDQALHQFDQHEAIVLWFEHDLFDQIILIYLLQWFAQQDLGQTQLTLICIDSFPSVDRFYGLGNLTAAQLATLFDTRRSVTAAEQVLAIAAWNAFCSPDPAAIPTFLQQDTTALPFLRNALLRHLQEYPSQFNGLNRTEQLALEAIATGITEPKAIFQAVQAQEAAPWLGDTMFWPYLKSLASGVEPLLAIAGVGDWTNPDSPYHIQITALGQRVLAGEADWIEVNGIDRWLGGVHLQGQNVCRCPTLAVS